MKLTKEQFERVENVSKDIFLSLVTSTTEKLDFSETMNYAVSAAIVYCLGNFEQLINSKINKY